MKIMNIFFICLVVTVGSFLLFNKNAMSHESIDTGDIVLMTFQVSETVVVYHKSTNTFLFYGTPDKRDGIQLLQTRNLSKDFLLAERLKYAELELEWSPRGYTITEVNQRATRKGRDVTHETQQGIHYPAPVSSQMKKEKSSETN